MYDKWMKVSRGFNLVYIGIIIVIISLIVGSVSAGMAAGAALAANNAGGLGLATIIGGLMFLGVFVGNLTGFVGRVFCLAIPEKVENARSLIMISVALEATSFFVTMLQQATQFNWINLSPVIALSLSGASLIMNILSPILFLYFAKSVAVYIRENDLADTAMTVLKLWIGLAVIMVLYYGMSIVVVGAVGAAVAAGGKPGAAAGGMAVVLGSVSCVTVIAGLVLGIIALIKFVNLMREMSAASARYARRVRKKLRERIDEDEEEDGEEEDEDEEDEEVKRPWRRGSRKPAFEVVEDEEEEEERPRKRRPSRDDDDEDEDYEERPRRRR